MPFRQATETDILAYAKLRQALWNDETITEHEPQIADILLKSDNEALNVRSFSTNGECNGFAEAAIRHDYVNGCRRSQCGRPAAPPSLPLAHLQDGRPDPARCDHGHDSTESLQDRPADHRILPQ